MTQTKTRAPKRAPNPQCCSNAEFLCPKCEKDFDAPAPARQARGASAKPAPAQLPATAHPLAHFCGAGAGAVVANAEPLDDADLYVTPPLDFAADRAREREQQRIKQSLISERITVNVPDDPYPEPAE